MLKTTRWEKKGTLLQTHPRKASLSCLERLRALIPRFFKMNLLKPRPVATDKAQLKTNLQHLKMRSMGIQTSDSKGLIKQLRKFFSQQVKVRFLQIVDLAHSSLRTLFKRQQQI
jgi:hypothetical protein